MWRVCSRCFVSPCVWIQVSAFPSPGSVLELDGVPDLAKVFGNSVAPRMRARTPLFVSASLHLSMSFSLSLFQISLYLVGVWSAECYAVHVSGTAPQKPLFSGCISIDIHLSVHTFLPVCLAV